MSDVIDTALAALQAKLPAGFSGGIAKFVIPGEGAIVADGPKAQVVEALRQGRVGRGG